jgi:hypothetical protein
VYEIGRREELHTIYILVAFNTLCFSKWCCWIYTNQRRHLKNGGVPHYLIPTASRSVLRASTLAQTKVSGDVGVSRWGSLGLQRWRTADECGWWAYDEAVARTNPGYEKKSQWTGDENMRWSDSFGGGEGELRPELRMFGGWKNSPLCRIFKSNGWML